MFPFFAKCRLLISFLSLLELSVFTVKSNGAGQNRHQPQKYFLFLPLDVEEDFDHLTFPHQVTRRRVFSSPRIVAPRCVSRNRRLQPDPGPNTVYTVESGTVLSRRTGHAQP